MTGRLRARHSGAPAWSDGPECQVRVSGKDSIVVFCDALWVRSCCLRPCNGALSVAPGPDRADPKAPAVRPGFGFSLCAPGRPGRIRHAPKVRAACLVRRMAGCCGCFAALAGGALRCRSWRSRFLDAPLARANRFRGHQMRMLHHERLTLLRPVQTGWRVLQPRFASDRCDLCRAWLKPDGQRPGEGSRSGSPSASPSASGPGPRSGARAGRVRPAPGSDRGVGWRLACRLRALRSRPRRSRPADRAAHGF